MQNKPNVKDAQINVTLLDTKDYENICDWTLGENKPNSNPIKAEIPGMMACSGAQMPFADKAGSVSIILQLFGNSQFVLMHIGKSSITASRIHLDPGVNTGTHIIPACQKQGPDRTVHGMGIDPSEEHSVICQRIHVWSFQIHGTISSGVKGSLVVGEEEDDVRPVRHSLGDGNAT